MLKTVRELTEGRAPQVVGEGAALVDPATGRAIYERPREPKERGPMALGSGAILVDPSTGRTIAENPKDITARETAADKEVAKKAVANLDRVVEAGEAARMDDFALQRLDALGPKIGTGAAAAIRGHLARFGIDLGDASDLQVFDAIVNRLTPTQRQGMPGAASDRDVAMFRGSLPALVRTVEGNREIVRTLRAMAQDRIKRAEIAEAVFSGDMTVPDALKKMRALPNPLERFREMEGTARAPRPGTVEDGWRFRGGNPADRRNWEPAR
jgi:hypothetical protein